MPPLAIFRIKEQSAKERTTPLSAIQAASLGRSGVWQERVSSEWPAMVSPRPGGLSVDLALSVTGGKMGEEACSGAGPGDVA